MTRGATESPHAAAAAEPRFLPARRRRRFPWAPWLLLLPVAIALVAVLGYPSYKLVTLSFQRYGLFELIQKKGHWIGLDNFDSVLHDRVFWDTVVRTVIFTIVNVLHDRPRALIALLLTKPAAGAHPAPDRARARLVDAGRRRQVFC
jgi:N,N'-diacetylchitobiose transport system permease protein